MANDAFGKYSFRMDIDDVNSGIKADQCTFTIYDSIYSFYPKITMNLNDAGGNINEYMGLVNGTKIDLYFGNDENSWYKCPYRVEKNSVPNKLQNTVGGNIELTLIHDYDFQQSKTCKAFQNNISDIIDTLTRKYDFSSRYVDSTFNSGIWYQPYLTDAEFMQNILLPNAFSVSTNNTPYFMYIDSTNKFNFLSYKTMTDKSSVQTFTLSSAGTIKSLELGEIKGLSFYQESKEQIKPFIRKMVGEWDKNGQWKSEKDEYLKDFDSLSVDSIPIRVNNDCIYSVKEQLDNDYYSEFTENNRKGQTMNEIKGNLFVDKVMISVSMDRRLKAGEKVRIMIPSTNDNVTTENSLRHSGDYIIEQCYHKWTGKDAITMLICGKNAVKVTSQYRNYPLIINR